MRGGRCVGRDWRVTRGPIFIEQAGQVPTLGAPAGPLPALPAGRCCACFHVRRWRPGRQAQEQPRVRAGGGQPVVEGVRGSLWRPQAGHKVFIRWLQSCPAPGTGCEEGTTLPSVWTMDLAAGGQRAPRLLQSHLSVLFS